MWKVSFTFLLVLLVKSSHNVELDWNTLKVTLMYAYSSFCTEKLSDWTCYWCILEPVPKMKVIKIFENNEIYGIYGYVGYTNTTIWASFRGSASLSNWLTDFEFFQEGYPDVPDASVHQGFYNAYQSVAIEVRKAVKSIKEIHPEFPVITTGHSLGAALSVLCAVDLYRENVTGVQLWNFGEPRVGNSAFAQYFNKVIPISRRIVNQGDLIVHYPAEFVGYRHVAQEVWFKSNVQNYTMCSKTNGEDKRCSDSIAPWDYSINDHLGYLGFWQPAGKDDGCANQW